MTKPMENFISICFEGAQAEDLTGDLALIAREIGIPATVQLAIAYRSCSFWIPRNGVDRLLRRLVIAAHQQGVPVRDIAIKINRSMRFVKKLSASTTRMNNNSNR